MTEWVFEPDPDLEWSVGLDNQVTFTDQHDVCGECGHSRVLHGRFVCGTAHCYCRRFVEDE